MSPLDDYQARALALCNERWPGEELAGRVLALCEETGEVARCVLKARSTHAGYRTGTDWGEQLRLEVGQVGFVLATIAEAAGFSLADAMSVAELDVEKKPTAADRADA